MDLSTVFQCVIDQMDADDMLDTAHAVLNEVLVTSPNPAPPPSFSTPDFGCDIHSQPMNDMNGGYEGYVTLETVSLNYEQQLLTEPMHSMEQHVGNNYYLDDMAGDMYSQGQYLPCEWTDYDATPTVLNAPLDPDLQFMVPHALNPNLTPAGIVNGEVVYEMPEVTSMPTMEPAPPAQNNSISSTRKKRYSQQDKNQPYVKKPPNAFMLYMKEQRANVVSELASSDNALVNTILGQRWRSLSSKDQAKYYKEAEKLRKLHAEKYPWWSPRDNYGKKRKRIRRKYRTVSDEEYEDGI